MNKKEANQKIYQACLFYKGMCYVMLDKPEQNIKAYRLQAIKFFDELLTKYPKSEFGPQCVLQIGTLYAVLENADKSAEYLKKLKEDYPDSDEAANSDFLLARMLDEMGRHKEAAEIYEKMFSGSGKYSDKQILAAGMALLEAKNYEVALKAFEKLKSSKDKSMIGIY